MDKAKVKKLFKIVGLLSENLTFMSSENEYSKESWDTIAWDIARAAEEIRNKKGLPDYDYSVIHSLRRIVYDTDQSVCALEILSPEKIQKVYQDGFARIHK